MEGHVKVKEIRKKPNYIFMNGIVVGKNRARVRKER